jgi:two-component system, OmpR family, sensor kinase
MFRSIRWTLQMWHAAILAMVLIVIGWVVFRLLRQTTYQQIDAGLDRMADLVDAGIRARGFRGRGFPPGSFPGGLMVPAEAANATRRWNATVRPNSTERAPVGEKAPVVEKTAAGATSNSTPKPTPTERKDPPANSVADRRTNPRGFAPEMGFGRRGDRPLPRLEVDEDFQHFFEEQETASSSYFIVWRADGSVVARSKLAADVPLPDVHQAPHELAVRMVQDRGKYREIIHQNRYHMFILVGRSIENDLAAMDQKGLILAGAAIAVLAGGLLGGHWFSYRAIKPIQSISATAAEISASNLSRRIDVTGTETELTSLARTLNSMFDRLEAAFDQQIRFTADASHELRTPLAVILSHAELALGKARPAEELRETIETCRRSALRMKSLVESLLTLARFDSGELQVEHRVFDVSRTAGDCVALVRPLAEQRRISMHMDLPPVSLTGDPDRIAQVITNLLTNAIRYNLDRGQVVISVQSSGPEVVLRVSDTGIGIPPEHLPNIFERFYRVDKARSRKDGAIGLGLAICRSIVEAHHGQITAMNRPEGGTIFEVRLPRNGSDSGRHSDLDNHRTDSLSGDSTQQNAAGQQLSPA